MTVAFTDGTDRRYNTPGTLAGPTEEYVPSCTSCGTDEFLVFEHYEPPQHSGYGPASPASVSYWCSACDQFSGHDVPDWWTPPAWRLTLK